MTIPADAATSDDSGAPGRAATSMRPGFAAAAAAAAAFMAAVLYGSRDPTPAPAAALGLGFLPAARG
jgi:hypothetical protein